MTPRKKASRTRKGAPRSLAHQPSRFTKNLKSIFFKLMFASIVLFALALLFMDTHIRKQFEGKRWAVPTKVYARPLELYSGLPLSLSDLKTELKGLGYQFVSAAKRPGQAEFSSTKAHLVTRGFSFPDGREPSQALQLQFEGETLTSIRGSQGNMIALTRLEPILIGGIYPLNNEDRDLIQLSDAPVGLKEALIAIEDRDFYQHAGISLKGISRAMWVNLKAGQFVQGGSTLTQQLIKNFYLSSDRSLARKLMEIPMAMLLELHYSKDEILEAYLNEVYLGQEGSRAIHGFGLASQYFFAQPLHELQLHQVALLAGLVKGPSYYDPRRHPERAKKRRNLVLQVLYEQQIISQSDYETAKNKSLGVVKQASLLKGAYPAYLDLVKRQLREEYRDDDLSSEGLRVFTALNPITQSKAETGLVSTITALQNQYGNRLDKLQGSMVVTDPQTGEVISIIGGKNTRYRGFNRALDAIRPIGSLAKPAVYLTALEHNYTLMSSIYDAPIEVTLANGDVWSPKNFDHQSHGVIPLHTALSHSYNQSTARLGLSLGVDKVIGTFRQLGVTRPLDPYPSLFLGAQGMSVMDVATMYQTIAANGFQMPLRAIRMVTDSTGKELSRYPFQLKQTLQPDSIHLLQYALQETARMGTARSIYQRLPAEMNVAGKTGTSNDQRDSWFAGFSGNRLAVTWLGLDDNSPLPVTGSSGALKAWTNYMEKEHLESFNALPPDNVAYEWINAQSGLLSNQGCENAIQMPFILGTAPTQTDGCAGTLSNSISNSFNWLKQWFQ
jgi:penicillin-binding protein 1B